MLDAASGGNLEVCLLPLLLHSCSLNNNIFLSIENLGANLQLSAMLFIITSLNMTNFRFYGLSTSLT